MRIALTGAAGFIGSHIADAYLAAGHEVLVVDDLSSGRREQVPQKARFVQADIRSAAAARALTDFRPDVLNHHAAQIEVRRSVSEVAFDAEVNVVGFLNVVEAARQAGARRVVFASSGGAIYGEQTGAPATEASPARPASPYGAAKASAELYLGAFQQMYGLHWVALRYSNVYGPRQNALGEAGVVALFANRCLAHQPCTIYGDGTQTRDFVFVEDVVRANVAALDCDHKGPINVATGVETDVNRVYALIAAQAGETAAPRYDSAKLGDVRRSVLDASLASRALNWRPQVAFAQGVARTVAWFKQQR